VDGGLVPPEGVEQALQELGIVGDSRLTGLERRRRIPQLRDPTVGSDPLQPEGLRMSAAMPARMFDDLRLAVHSPVPICY
jgi:hypothetical protein